MPDSLLERLAHQRGLGDAYHDYRGDLRSISLATKTAILAAMGCQVDDAAALERELAELDGERWSSLLPPVAVIGAGRTGAAVAVAAGLLEGSLEWRVVLEGGGEIAGCVRAADLTEIERREIGGCWSTRRLLVMPEDLPEGYHSLQVRIADGIGAECALIVAPGRCFEPSALAEGSRLWGVAAQLYTLRSASNWGIGDFADLETVVRRCAAQGAAFIGLNPLHALFTANPRHFSPYSPSSRHFLNAFYIAVEQVPEFRECEPARRRVAEPCFGAELERLRAAAGVDYPGVAAAKLAVLRDLHEHFRSEHVAHGTGRAAAFHAYVAERGEPLRLHAVHEAIDEHLRNLDGDRYWGWPVWPEEFRNPGHAGVSEFARTHGHAVEFHAWLQWLADEQLAHVQRVAREMGMPIGLYGDYAVGVNPGGSETWSDPAVYRTGASVGAPPDALALKGQDWGILPQDPHALTAERYRPFRDLVAANMRHFGALRLDHVMALFRQWWVPAGLGATEGGYVHYPVADLMAVLALESRRHACLVVGEDLGTVPPEMIHAMAERGVYSYKVLLFEKHGDGRFRSPGEYLRRAIATVTTHDLPTLRGYWEGTDIELRARLALYPSDEIRRCVDDERVRDRAALLLALDNTGLLAGQPGGSAATKYTPELSHGVHLYLARSAAALVALQIEDLAGMVDPVNVPGTSDEYANWQRKVTASVDEILGRDDVLRLLRDVQRARDAGRRQQQDQQQATQESA